MKRLGLVVGTLALLAWHGTARAGETEGARLFREGRAQMLEARFDEACPKIAESQRLEPHVGTLLNLAACHERQGKVASAWVEYQKGLTAAHADGQGQRARLAQQRIDVLERRVPWLTIVPPLGTPASDLVVTLDGGVVQPVAWGKEMPVDPGAHVVGAATAGKPSFSQTLDVREGEHVMSTVDFAVIEPLPAETAASTLIVDPGAGVAPAEPAPPSATPPRSRWVLEPGVFVGFMSVHSDHATLVGGSESIALSSSAPSPGDANSCAQARCTYSLPTQDGPILGLDLYAGYAFTDELTGGLRLLAGPRVNRGAGGVVAFGPSVSLRASPTWTFGAWALIGSADVGGTDGAVQPSAPYHRNGGGSEAMEAGTSMGAGLGFEAAWRLFDLPRGAVSLTATPFFFVGSNGSAWSLPVGVAYRFQ